MYNTSCMILHEQFDVKFYKKYITSESVLLSAFRPNDSSVLDTCVWVIADAHIPSIRRKN